MLAGHLLLGVLLFSHDPMRPLSRCRASRSTALASLLQSSRPTSGACGLWRGRQMFPSILAVKGSGDGLSKDAVLLESFARFATWSTAAKVPLERSGRRWRHAILPSVCYGRNGRIGCESCAL